MLDYIEGNLDPLLTADLMAFLAENPEFEGFLPEYNSKISLAKTYEFTCKELLKKNYADIPEITPGNFDEFCIASCEGLLTEKDVSRLTEYLACHPDKQADLDLYRKLNLEPDFTLHFPRKEKLKIKQARVILPVLYYAAGIAAAVTLVIILVFRQSTVNSYTYAPSVNSDLPDTVVSTHPIQPVPDGEKETPQEPALASRQQVDVISRSESQPPVIREVSGNILPYLTRITSGSLPHIDTPAEPPRLAVHPVHFTPDLGKTNTGLSASESYAQTYLRTLIGRLNLWKTAETALDGFNYLTESQLSIGKTTDENGKLTSLLIDTERFRIKGSKFK